MCPPTPARSFVDRSHAEASSVDSPSPDRLLEACLSAVLPQGGRLLVAVSGGSDSMALLGAVHAWWLARNRGDPGAPALEPAPLVGHVHHGQRPSADQDARLVQEVSGQLGLPCEVLRAPPPHGSGPSSESAARQRRMDALADQAQRRAVDVVLAAHHQGDAQETLLLHLLRGHRGDRARAGIPTLRRLRGEVALVHPFLLGERVPNRDDLRVCREARGLPFVEDPTNAEMSIPRNALRRLIRDARPPLDRLTLERERLQSRRRLRERVTRVAQALEQGWRPEGRGCVVQSDVWQPPPGETAESWLPEVLRLLGSGLGQPRYVAPRAGVLKQLVRLVASRSGTLEIPASPTSLLVKASRIGLHLPHEALPELDPAARVLSALSRTSLHL